MNPSLAVVDRFDNVSDYLRSSEFKKKPKSNIFTPSRKVNSKPAENNFFPFPYEIKFKIAQHLNLKDFASFSSMNVDNYLSLRSDNLLVSKVLDNEVQERMLAILEDVKQRAQKQNFTTIIPLNHRGTAIIPPAALSEGPAKLTFDCQNLLDLCRSDLYQAFEHLCMIAKDDSTDALSRAHICSLTIDINNRMHQKLGNIASRYAFGFIRIASGVNQLKNFEDKENKLNTLADMIEKEEVSHKKLFFTHKFKPLNEQNLFEWVKFLDTLR